MSGITTSVSTRSIGAQSRHLGVESVRTAADGAEAMRLLESSSPKIALCPLFLGLNPQYWRSS
jgi:hypothetical protein